MTKKKEIIIRSSAADGKTYETNHYNLGVII